MLNELTQDQLDQLPAFRDKWIKIGMDTGDLNVERSLELIKAIYEKEGLVFPDKFRVFDSPMGAIKGMKDEFDVDVTPQDFCYGAHDASWLAFYDVFRTACNIEACNDLSNLMELAEHCGWWLAFDEVVVLTRKPTEISLDAEGLLHSESGCAIKYKDGQGVSAWHGTRVPREWIEDPTSITTEIALKWENIEQRRAACEIVGWDNVISQLNPVTIDKDGDDEVGELIEVQIPDIGKERFLRVKCGTGRWFALPVPPEMKTALDANCWTYGIDKVDFKPDFRT